MTSNDRLSVRTRCLTATPWIGGVVCARVRLLGLMLALACSVRLAPGAEVVSTSRADSSPAIIHKAAMGDYGSDYVRLGDLDGDGMLDILCIQADAPGNPPGYQGGEHVATITCLTAVDMNGKILWQIGKPDLKNLYCGGDHPVQIHDIDGDGRNEVIYIPDKDNVAHIVEGKTGRLLRKVQLAGGHDSILFADFTGQGEARDLLVKDRYSSFWVYDRSFKLLWERRDCNPGHYPMACDVNGDGKIELVCGYTLYARDGKVLWSRPELGGHSDAVYVEDMDDDGKAEIAIAASHGETSEQATLLDADGKVLWRKVCDHCQFALIGRFRPDLPGKQVCFVDRQIYRYPPEKHTGEVSLCTRAGEKLWSRQLHSGDVSGALRIDRWTADPNVHVLAIHSQTHAPPCVLDGFGRTIAVFPFPEAIEKPGGGPDGKDIYGAYMMHHIDCYGDPREEIFLINHKMLYIWTNSAGGDAASKPAWRKDLHRQLPRMFNNTVYTGRG